MTEINSIENIVKEVSKTILMPFYQQVKAQTKADGSLITEADISVQDAIEKKLLELYPDYGFFAEELSSEALESFFLHNQTGYWCLDPIDGTSNFAAGLPFFSISLALIINGETQLGLIYDPVRDECFTALKGQGAYMNGKLIGRSNEPQQLKDCLALVDFKRLCTTLSCQIITRPPYRSQRSFGSIALDWCWLAMGRGHIYVHGKQMLWDYAAGLLIAEEADCVACSFGEEEQSNTIFEESLKPKKVIASVNEKLQKQWLKVIT
ncbi:inositol monophosphatase family protein [sulfur-oxidizing endosymbiont of Gigantopelta aegis]|uniref:inositol monophosphatase family protein n=1 Tax=sulfur-oxidizing endosymbiont of Gigantopelta aegis TaxID=2794934 RepID=UPI002484719B|nr:inositol monophosphatase family protein [sulfur-oxidizing endosymbiont of Gigantopelta aegis]